MKKLFVLMAALVLLLSATATAEVKVETDTLTRSVILCDATNCFYARVNGSYQVFDAQGNALSLGYPDLTARQGGLYYEFPGSGLNYVGLLDARGQLLIPPSYNQIRFLDDDWALGYVLEPATGDVGDFSDRSTGEKYLLQRADVLYQGRVIGALTREEFLPSYNAGVTGPYMYVRQTTESGYYIDKAFNKTVVAEDFITSEFTSVYRQGVFHNPTQQWAFCEGCTLTEDQVSNAVWYDDNADCLIDLQGNVIKSGLKFDYVRAYGEYFSVRLNKLYGIMDKQGNIIVEPIYKEIPYSYEGGLFASEYQTALTEKGCLHYLDKQGNVTASVEYELSTSDYKGASSSAAFAVVNNMGKYIVITATHGELPTKYEDYLTPQNGQKLLVLKKDGLWGAIDMAGNTVVPFIHKYSMDHSDDSSVIVGAGNDNKYYLYRMTYEENAAADVQEPAATEETKPALNAGEWQCACGAVSTGKFCGECGSRKPEPTATPAPVDDGSWDCTCGAHNTGKFCPECGAKKPDAAPTPAPEPQCPGCGYKPEGAVPKFCPECGTKF